MTSLHILKQLLPLNEEDIEKKTFEKFDVENLQSFVKTSKGKEATSLEQIRTLCSNSLLSNTTIEQLNTLIEQFETYKLDIRSHRAKLKPIETVIANFNAELKQLSSSLIDSREKSFQLSKDLVAQSSLTDKLNPIILDLMVPPDIVKSLISAPILESWLENLRFINEKLQLIDSIEKKLTPETAQYNGSVAYKQLTECIDAMKFKAIERIRDHIIINVKKLRATNTQLLSQNIQKELLVVKEIFPFIFEHHPDLAKQLRLAYIYTMKWYYETRFAKYIYALEKLKLRYVDASLLLGSTTSAEERGGGIFGWFSSSTSSSAGSNASINPGNGAGNNSSNSNGGSPLNVPHTHKIIMAEYLPSIEKRVQILHLAPSEEEQPEEAIPSQIAETTPFAYWIEFVYKQWSVALIDNLIVEYLFMVDFFYLGDEKFDEIEILSTDGSVNKYTVPQDGAQANGGTSGTKTSLWSTIMFSNVFKMGQEFVNWLITYQPLAFLTRNPNSNTRIISSAANVASASIGSTTQFGTYDGYAVLLMIRMVQISQSSLHNEFHIPIADEYLNSILLLLWPHFTKIIDLNCELIKKSVIHSSTTTKFDGGNLAPVSVTQQFAQYLVGLLKLAESSSSESGGTTSEAFQGEPLFTSVSRLRNDFESLLTKLSGTMFSKSKKIEKEIFLYNNYFLVVNILRNEKEENRLFTEQIEHFELLCQAYKK